MALTSLNASTNALANYTSLTNNTTGSGTKNNSSKTQETQTNVSGSKSTTSSTTSKVKEAQSPAVTKSISADAWNYSSTPSAPSSPSTSAPGYDTKAGQPPGREGERQGAASGSSDKIGVAIASYAAAAAADVRVAVPEGRLRDKQSIPLPSIPMLRAPGVLGVVVAISDFLQDRDQRIQGLLQEKKAPAEKTRKEGEAKSVPNPNGRKGDEAHQAGVQAAEAEMKAKYGNDPSARVRREVRVETPEGEKTARYLDVGVTGGEPRQLIEGVQIGRTTKSGIPVARERRALSDIDSAAPTARVGFRDSAKR